MSLVCDNCGKTLKGERELQHTLPDIPALEHRLDPGGMVPAGTCPACGCLVYPLVPARNGKAATETCEDASGKPERRFFVAWAIDVFAGGFREAAREALRIQRRRDSIATVFEVTCSATGSCRTVDLSESHCPVVSRDEQYTPAARASGERVVIVVRGGVAEVAVCPQGVTVELRDYDTEGCDPERLEPDGSIVSVVSGPVPDAIDEFAAGAAEELAGDGFTEKEAMAIASEAAAIIREHEARKSGKEVS